MLESYVSNLVVGFIGQNKVRYLNDTYDDRSALNLRPMIACFLSPPDKKVRGAGGGDGGGGDSAIFPPHLLDNQALICELGTGDFIQSTIWCIVKKYTSGLLMAYLINFWVPRIRSSENQPKCT